MSAVDVMLERETANDESASIVTVLVQSGTAVTEDQLLFEIENSKAVQELRAPQAGIVAHDLAVGTTVGFGIPIARIYDPAAWNGGDQAAPIITSPEPEPVSAAPPAIQKAAVQLSASAPPVAPKPARSAQADRVDEGAAAAPAQFSHAAHELMAKFSVPQSTFTTGFITSSDVLAAAGQAPAPSSPPRAASGGAAAKAPAVPPPKNAGEGQAVDFRKRVEIETLTAGAGATMLSVLGIDLGALTIPRAPGDLLAGRITDLVIFEASRLMRKHPKLNAAYADGRVYLHEAVHAGLAIDSGGRLVVYGIENADRASLSEIGETITEAVARYMDNTLTAAEMTRATFTVTDLTATELDFVLPLLPRGQTCILGVTNAKKSGFKIYAGFDHRVTEGGEIAAFLGELRDRVMSFATTAKSEVEELSCDYCGRTTSEVVTKNRDKGLLSIRNQKGEDTLCCASCWNGW